jgi:CheY-like chemotaxis protein
MSDYILIVDDNPDTLEIITRTLARIGYECETAENGEKALAMVAARRPGLIITDLMMPKVNGFTLLTSLQRDSGTARIPIILVSGVASPQMELLPGVIKVIVKGALDLTDLRAEVQRILPLAQPEEPAQGTPPADTTG